MLKLTKMKGLKFIDLFAGIGGFHQALSSQGGKCVFASDWDSQSRKTYEVNYSMTPFGDIRQITDRHLPNYDILCAGFPCQPFSIAGVSKKKSLGKKHGFEDGAQGNLFFEIIRLVNVKRPKIIFLENVKNLKSHNKGDTWKIIYTALREHGYEIFHKIIDSSYYVPQKRQRIFIVCFDKHIYQDIHFNFPNYPLQREINLKTILEDEVDKKYTLSNNMWAYLQKHKENSAKKGNGFGLVHPSQDEYTRTMSARYYKDGSEILIFQGKTRNPRRLTPSEARRLFGYPDNFIIPVSDTQAYKQFGNSVVVPVVRHIAEQITKTLQYYAIGDPRAYAPQMKFSLIT